MEVTSNCIVVESVPINYQGNDVLSNQGGIGGNICFFNFSSSSRKCTHSVVSTEPFIVGNISVFTSYI